MATAATSANGRGPTARTEPQHRADLARIHDHCMMTTMRSETTPPSSTRVGSRAGAPRVRGLALGLAAGLLAGCGTFHPPQIPPPVRAPKADVVTDDVLREENRERNRPLVEPQAQPALAGAAASSEPARGTPQAPIRKPVAIVLDGVHWRPSSTSCTGWSWALPSRSTSPCVSARTW